MSGNIKICMCCGYPHEKVEIRLQNMGNGVVAVYTCPKNKSMAYLTETYLKKIKE